MTFNYPKADRLTTPCALCPLRKLPLFDPFSDEDVRFTQKFKVGEIVLDPGAPLLMEGSNSPQLFTALRGLGLRFKLLESGRRQVLSFVFPGDFVGLQAGVLREMYHSVEATTRMTLCVFDRSAFWSFFRHHPERAFDLTWLAALEERFLGETVASLGQRTGLEKLAWALVRIYQRAEALDLVANRAMQFPYRQQDLADALGMSLVHTNKTLSKLRDRQLLSWRDGELMVNDIEALARVADMQLETLSTRPLI